MRITTVRRVIAVGLVALAFAASGAPGIARSATPAPLPALGLAVSGVQVVSNVKTPMTAPGLVDKATLALDSAVRNWATTKLLARGGPDVARFTVTEAKVVEHALAKNAGLPGIFRTPQNVRYDASIAGQLEIFDKSGKRLAYATARVSNWRTFNDRLSEDSFNMMMASLIAAVLPDFEVEMEASIHQHVGAFLTP